MNWFTTNSSPSAFLHWRLAQEEESGSKQEAQDKDSILAHASSETDSERVESHSSGSESLESASTSTPKSESEKKSEVSAGRVPTLSEVMDGSTIGTRI